MTNKLFNCLILSVHMLSHTGHKPHACEICDKKFSLKANLKRHMLTHTGENPFACTECTKKFKSRRALKLHLMIHRNEKPFVYVSSFALIYSWLVYLLNYLLSSLADSYQLIILGML